MSCVTQPNNVYSYIYIYMYVLHLQYRTCRRDHLGNCIKTNDMGVSYDFFRTDRQDKTRGDRQTERLLAKHLGGKVTSRPPKNRDCGM